MFAPLVAWLRRQRIPFSENAAIAPHLYFSIGGTVSLLVPALPPRSWLAVLQEARASARVCPAW